MDAQMRLFSGNNKKGRPTAVTLGDRTAKLRIMFRTRRSSGFAPASTPTYASPAALRSPPAYPYTRVRRRFRLLIKTRVREGFQGFLPGFSPEGRWEDVGEGRRRRVFTR